MKNIKFTFILISIFISFTIFGLLTINSASYYKNAEGLSGNALKSALHEIVNDHNKISYSKVWWALNDLNEDPYNSNKVKLIYTRRSVSKYNGSYTGEWNREHSWPKSHGFETSSWPAYTDLHHLFPADVSVNSARGTKDYDDGGSRHSEATLCYTDSNSWEPPDDVKGDLARGYFYMSIRYEGDRSNETDLEIVENANNTNPGGTTIGVLSTLLKWHKNDPVSQLERERNEKIFNNYQGNRNPFIDHPEWVEKIW